VVGRVPAGLRVRRCVGVVVWPLWMNCGEKRSNSVDELWRKDQTEDDDGLRSLIYVASFLSIWLESRATSFVS
jgi:hypothetical protein